MIPKKILCVEDDTFFLSLITGLLESTPGITVVPAHNGAEGVQKARVEHPDLVLLDLMLPDIRGSEVILRIRELSGMEHTPIFILSNFGDHDEVELCLKNGAKAYLVKSNTLPSEVVEMIVKELGVERMPVVDPSIESQWPKQSDTSLAQERELLSGGNDQPTA
jgi:CheY-like chemotaxis protein